MTVISDEYLYLFNAVTDAVRALDRLRADLLEAQRRAEELYLERDDSSQAPCGGKTVDLSGEMEYNTTVKAP